MPVYDYLCANCGPFTAMRLMAECEVPQICPGCAAKAPRAYLTAPNLAALAQEQRIAHAVNERSAAAPDLASTKTGGHGKGCGCCGGVSARSAKREKSGAKNFPSKRPWMISH